MTLVEREERYLLMLRRAALGFARLLLVLACLALVTGVCMYGWAEFTACREFNLPSQAALSPSVDPCDYLTNSGAESNGRDSEGSIPVKRVLSGCDTTAVTLPTFESPGKAHAAFAVDLIETQKALGWRYNSGESDALEQWRKQVDGVEKMVLRSVDNSTPDQQLVVATVLAGYSARLRRAASPSAAWIQAQDEALPSPEDPALDTSRPRVSRSVIEHLIDLRFVTNQLGVTVRKAKLVYDETLVKASALKVSAVTAGYVSVSLFASFLVLMLVFVFIKIEVDLRDIRNSFKDNQASAHP
jgi:hypothetical protein